MPSSRRRQPAPQHLDLPHGWGGVISALDEQETPGHHRVAGCRWAVQLGRETTAYSSLYSRPVNRLRLSAGMCSETAVRRRVTEQPRSTAPNGWAFPQVNPSVVGLAGLEPAASSLSEMDGRALCYPAFSLVVLLRKSYNDGVNYSPSPPPARRQATEPF